MLSYIVRDASGTPAQTGNHHFAVYDSGTVRHIGGVEAGKLLDGATGIPKVPLIEESDRGALADLFRDSATFIRPPWWSTVKNGDIAPYTTTTRTA